MLSLTDQERELLHHVAHGRSDEELAQIFGLSVNAAKNAAQAVTAKLGLSSRWQVADWVRRHTQFFLREE